MLCYWATRSRECRLGVLWHTSYGADHSEGDSEGDSEGEISSYVGFIEGRATRDLAYSCTNSALQVPS